MSGSTEAAPGTRLQPRKLHIRWVDAGEHRPGPHRHTHTPPAPQVACRLDAVACRGRTTPLGGRMTPQHLPPLDAREPTGPPPKPSDAAQSVTRPGTRLQPRKLHIRWVDAGERRLVARALKSAGFSSRHISRLLQVSPSTIAKDLAS